MIERIDYDNATPAERAEHLAEVAALARRLMESDHVNFKVGYTFANALNAACEAAGIQSVIRVAMVAERLHRLLVEAYDRGEVMGL
jgi:hypothetical protein